MSVSVPNPHADNVKTVHFSSSSLIVCPNYTTTLLVGKTDSLKVPQPEADLFLPEEL